ncbi:MAG TPA: phospholipase domain-containing protein, partial [Vicinamibacterales bacterium]|nr:phospholipase domain-containing protein [Vicinamibacterales bacterium]
ELLIGLAIVNQGTSLVIVTITDLYGGEKTVQAIPAGHSFKQFWPRERSFGWYDFTIAVNTDHNFNARVAGHIENGRDSISDPALSPFVHREAHR